MREIIVLSGKGGAGKTSLTAAFAALAQKTVVCDLDVDAPDLHILLDPKDTVREDFFSGTKPRSIRTCATTAAFAGNCAGSTPSPSMRTPRWSIPGVARAASSA
jgi:MinD superfamily P-loop ATPase